MSAPTASANKPGTTFNEEIEALYESHPSYTLSRFCAEPPWPEWSDAELNAETWDEGRVQRASTANGVKTSTVARPVFDDPNPPTFTPSLTDTIYTWKRPKDVFKGEDGTEELMVYNPTNTEFVLSVPKSCTKCEFFQTFMEQMRILQFYAAKHKFMVEMETPNFSPTTQGEIWRPWHHVYALCKAGKGQVHKPLYCPYGKYVVRLFYMGVWRKFVVDDKIPCDLEGNCLFPVTQYPGELWPIILMKALLKILSLTPSNHFSVTDFPLLTLFTGWVQGGFLAANKSNEQIWDRFIYLIPRYEQPPSEAEPEEKSAAPSLKNHGRKESAKKESRKEVEVVEPKNERFCFLMANLGLRKTPLGDSIGITMVRDRPLIRAVRRSKTKPWKKIRWEQWAKEKGLWVDDTTLPPYRRLQIISYDLDIRQVLYPDPKLETALFDLPMEDTAEIENNIADVPEEWCDYLKFLEFVRVVNVFFKPSSFFGSFKISCLTQRAPDNTTGGKGTPGGKRTAKAVPTPQNTFVFPASIKHSGNEPIFLLCESQTGIFLFISLWVCPVKGLPNVGYLRRDQPKLLKVGHAALIVELHDWRSYEQGGIVGLVKTVGNSSIPVNLKAGRHVLKLWLSTDSAYVIDVYSNSNVYVGKGPRIRFLMSSETQRILNYINNVSNAFIALTLKFGKPDLPKALREFYNVIKPGNDCALGYLRKLDLFIETFLNCILLLLKELIPSPEEFWSMVGSLRCLFINPDLYSLLPKFPNYGSPKAPVISNYNLTPPETYAVVVIQRHFRGYRIRLLWKCQTPARKEFKVYSERLKKICDTVFVPVKRELEVGKLLRRIVMLRPELLTTYKFHQDFANILHVDEFTGKIANVEPFAWVPITRFVIGCHSEDLVPCFFYLSCNLERFVIQGFNNDTGDEIFRVSNSVSSHYYHKNTKGYTILAFGWNEANFKSVNWRLEMVRMKHFQMVHLCNLLLNASCQPYSIPNLEIFELRNFYVPNSKSRICRCLIKIHKRALLTLRLSLSYTDVQFELRISLKGSSDADPLPTCSNLNDDNKVVWRVVSKNGVVIVPSLLLECGENGWNGEPSENGATVFSIEAFVLNNSWPLTKQEWGLVEPLRVNGESRNGSSTSLLSRKGRPESKKKIGRTSRKSLSDQKVMDNPLWVLQVLNDLSLAETGEPIVIEEDKSHAEAVKAMKAMWKEKDPGRRKKGKDMRMRFLYRTLLEERKNKLYGEDAETYEGEEETPEDPQWMFDRLSSFSYLTNDTSPTRYTYSPRILPGMPLMELLCKYRKHSSVTTGLKETRSDDSDTEISFTIVRNMIDEIEEDRKDFSMQCTHYRTVLMNHINEELRLSNRLMEQAYEDRLKALESFKR